MVMIKEYDEDSLYNAARSFLKTKGFKEYFNKQVVEIRKHYSGHVIEKEEFNLKSFKYGVVDDVVNINLVFDIKPSNITFDVILGERWDEWNDERDRFVESFNSWTNDLSEKVKEVIWAAVYNYPVLRVVNSGFDSIPLGDFADFDVVVEVNNDIDLSNVRF